MKSDALLEVGRIGKRVGLKGGLKLHPTNDFPEVFSAGASFQTEDSALHVKQYDAHKHLIFFKGFDTPELSQKLINKTLFMSQEETRSKCHLEKDEFFWFDIEGCEVIEKNCSLGTVKEIQRLSGSDFLSIKTSSSLVEKGLTKEFLIPYVARYIEDVNIEQKCIYTSGAKELLESL